MQLLRTLLLRKDDSYTILSISNIRDRMKKSDIHLAFSRLIGVINSRSFFAKYRKSTGPTYNMVKASPPAHGDTYFFFFP
ncbi:hypothetical protein POVCU2_0043900 [Plasmodium ovale curtisi]|uniref:Uncharacterized protein n=1 Tax=Plasmodium ovale curtisi TaxID=864141 RepID=A0A1A8W434_PLAOA|nr:hypothetical protein POVCU2_0043900 [Plasmodium ovale curtisi]SBS97742.1 hypothetical protein POVCU1_040590 [Plasmodium ovale curtisi]